jgi:heme A synthase
VGWLLLLGCAVTILLGVSGAVTALGDTLFPSGSLAEGLSQDFSPTAHFLIRLRIFHPAIAIGVGIFLLVVGAITRIVRPGRYTERFSRFLFGLFVLQLAIGSLNVVLLAPIPMQILHLLMADAVWITLVLLTASALAEQPAPASAPVQGLLGRQ